MAIRYQATNVRITCDTEEEYADALEMLQIHTAVTEASVVEDEPNKTITLNYDITVD